MQLQTNLEVVAATVWYQTTKLTVCSLYLPPNVPFPKDEFKDLLNELPSPFLILGDFNSKNSQWGSPLPVSENIAYKRGTELLEIIEPQSLHILNTGKPTYFRVNDQYYSHIDLSLGSPEVCTSFNWDTEPDPHDSDHFPIIISHSLNNIYTTKTANWDLERTSQTSWENFQKNINLPPLSNFTNSTDACQAITEHILEVAEQFVKKTSTNINTKYFNPWWNEDCAKAIKEKRKRLRILKRGYSENNLIEYKRAAAKARYIIKTSKKISWCKFVSTINRYTPIKTVWKRIRKIDNKTYNASKIVIQKDNIFIPAPQEVVSILGTHFSSISSNENYSDDFKEFKTTQENNPIFFEEANHIEYNRPFTIFEYKTALNSTKNSTPGEDGIPYELYKHFPPKEQIKILEFINHIWIIHDFPEQWKNAHIIPILKPKKPSHDPNSYRPISLTISLCKLMEKMIAKRLMSYLIENNTIVEYQYGFQKNKSTLDPLIQLEHAIRESFLHFEYMVVVILDIEKAYDMVWAYGLLQELINIGLKGNLPIFIHNFLNNRTIQVKINDFISNKFKIENGLPQGSIISVYVFLIAINKLFKNCNLTNNKLFCDDGMFWCKEHDLAVAERKIQDTLNHLTTWSNQNGLKFSPQKSSYCIFSWRKKRDLNLKLLNQNLTRSYQIKYLGVILDERLTWKLHIMNVLKRKMHQKITYSETCSKQKVGI